MNTQEALSIIDDMISGLDAAFDSRRDRCTSGERAYYDHIDAEHAANMETYASLRAAIQELIKE